MTNRCNVREFLGSANDYRASDECGRHVQNSIVGIPAGDNAHTINRLHVLATDDLYSLCAQKSGIDNELLTI